MAGARLATEGILLTRKPSGEHGMLLIFLSPDQGLLRAFARTSSSRNRQPIPDLFDEVSLTLEKAKTGGDLWFVDEYRLQRRRSRVGENYQALLYACRYCLLLTHHLFPVEEAPFWTNQLQQGLDAWETGNRPDVAFFKILYLFARHQGIPVKEEWLLSLPEARREIVHSILRHPLTEQTTPIPAVKQLITDFEHYLQTNHDIRITSSSPLP